MLYLLLIPHADDYGNLTGCPEEIILQVIPFAEDFTPKIVEETLKAIVDAELIEWDGEHVFFPLESFYKHQSYINTSKYFKAEERRKALKKDPTVTNTVVSDRFAAKHRKTPQNINSLYGKKQPRKREYTFAGEDKRLAEKHMANVKEFAPDVHSRFDIEQQADAVRKMREIDRIPVKDIEEMIDFVAQDDFWRDNAISLAAWRKVSKTNDLPKWKNIMAGMVKDPEREFKDPIKLYWGSMPRCSQQEAGDFDNWIKNNPDLIEKIKKGERTYGNKRIH